MWLVVTAPTFGAYGAATAADRRPMLQDLAPTQLYAVQSSTLTPPVPLPPPETSDISRTDAEDAASAQHAMQSSAPDIPYQLFWDEEMFRAHRSGRVSEQSPGIRGARVGWRPNRPQSTWLRAPSNDPWTLGASNWRYSSDQGLDVTLGNDQIVVPAWGSSTRLGGISLSQSSLISSEGEESWGYSMSFGALDHSGEEQGDLVYGSTAGNTVLRYDLSEQLRLESQVELAPDLVTTGVGGQYDAERWGVWSAGVAKASYGLYQGWRYLARYQFDVTDTLELSWRGERQTNGFTDLAHYRDASTSPGEVRHQWTATVPLGRWGDLSGSFENAHTDLGDTQRRFGLTQQFWYSPNLRIGLKAERELVSGDYDVGIRFSVPIY